MISGKLKYIAAALLWGLAIRSVPVAKAQERKPLEHEWLAKDVQALEALRSLMPPEDQTVEGLRVKLGDRIRIEEEDRGFGLQRITADKPGGYTHLAITMFVFRGVTKDYEISVSGSTQSWPLIRSALIAAWIQNGGPEFKEADESLSYRKSIEPALESYKAAVDADLGGLKPVEVPLHLQEAYELLISPFHSSVVGRGACGYGGVTPMGKDAIDRLVKAKRIDLITNVLRGYNPGGRVYAALALQDLEKKGLILNDEIDALLKRVQELDIRIQTCSGCIYSLRTAKEILTAPDGAVNRTPFIK